jgi:predicted Holliday junction resolvase-like endonuclease
MVQRSVWAEHIVSYLPNFKYNPKDASFLGSPVDFVLFDGLDEGQVKKSTIY